MLDEGILGAPVENKHYIVFVSQQNDHNKFANKMIYVEQRGHVTKTCMYIVHSTKTVYLYF